MAKQRQVVSVHIDIAALVWATRGLNSESEWAIWGRSFVEALATQAPEKNQFAAQLIGDVVEFREKEAERIRNLRNVHVQNVQGDVQTERKKESQLVRELERDQKQTSNVPPSRDDSQAKSKSKKEFPEESDPYQAAKYLARYITEWDQSVKITPQKIQGWAREADLMNRVDGRSWAEFRELVAWFDAGKHKPSKSGFSWAKVIRSMGSIREKWNDGKFYEFQEYMAKGST